MHRFTTPLSILTLLACLMALPGSRACADKPLGFIVLNKDVHVPDSGDAALPRTMAGDILTCTDTDGRGYHVFCSDAEGRTRVGFLPYRNEWGHATADAWTHDGDLAPDTIRVRIPHALRPGRLSLKAGDRFAVLAKTKTAYEIRYHLNGAHQRLRVLHRVATWEAGAAEPIDPAERHMAQLTRTLAESISSHDALTQRVGEAHAENTKLVDLLGQIAALNVENRALELEAQDAEAIRAWLMAYTGKDAAALTADNTELDGTMTERRKASLRQIHAQLDAAPMRALIDKIALANTDLNRITADTIRTEAMLKGLSHDLSDEALMRERSSARARVAKANQDLKSTQETVQTETAVRDRLAGLVATLERIREDDERVQEQLIVLKEEVAGLREQIGVKEAKPPAKAKPPAARAKPAAKAKPAATAKPAAKAKPAAERDAVVDEDDIPIK